MLSISAIFSGPEEECNFCFRSTANFVIDDERIGPDGEDSCASVFICRACTLKNSTYRRLAVEAEYA